MADVFEQNLPSKANLSVATNGDYLRVVGSDNNSYKQLVNDVAKKIIENYTNSSLAGSNQSVKAALDSLNSKTTVEAITFTPASGITSNISMRKVGNIVIINGYVTSSTAFSSSETVIGTIPAGSRPADAVRALAGVANQAYLLGDYAYVSVGSQGNVAITAKSGNTYKVAYFSVSYASYY